MEDSARELLINSVKDYLIKLNQKNPDPDAVYLRFVPQFEVSGYGPEKEKDRREVLRSAFRRFKEEVNFDELEDASRVKKHRGTGKLVGEPELAAKPQRKTKNVAAANKNDDTVKQSTAPAKDDELPEAKKPKGQSTIKPTKSTLVKGKNQSPIVSIPPNGPSKPSEEEKPEQPRSIHDAYFEETNSPPSIHSTFVANNIPTPANSFSVQTPNDKSHPIINVDNRPIEKPLVKEPTPLRVINTVDPKKHSIPQQTLLGQLKGQLDPIIDWLERVLKRYFVVLIGAVVVWILYIAYLFLKPVDDRAIFTRAVQSYKKGNYHEGRRALDSIIVGKPQATSNWVADSLYNRGVDYYNLGDFSNVLEIFMKSDSIDEKSDTVDAKSAVMIGRMYYNGDGVDQSDKLALDWYNKAIQQKNESAQYYLAKLYAKPGGEYNNIPEAEKSLMRIINSETATDSLKSDARKMQAQLMSGSQ